MAHSDMKKHHPWTIFAPPFLDRDFNQPPSAAQKLPLHHNQVNHGEIAHEQLYDEAATWGTYAPVEPAIAPELLSEFGRPANGGVANQHRANNFDPTVPWFAPISQSNNNVYQEADLETFSSSSPESYLSDFPGSHFTLNTPGSQPSPSYRSWTNVEAFNGADVPSPYEAEFPAQAPASTPGYVQPIPATFMNNQFPTQGTPKSREFLDFDMEALPAPPMNGMQGNQPPVVVRHDIFRDNAAQARRELENRMLVELKDAGLTYVQIHKKLGFSGEVSTLRGRYRAMIKPKTQRQRKPTWEKVDIRLLKEAVKIERTLFANRKDISWKNVQEYIVKNGGTYRFGFATCKKKAIEIGVY